MEWDSVNTDVIVAKGKLVSFNLMQYYIKIIKNNKFFSFYVQIPELKIHSSVS